MHATLAGLTDGGHDVTRTAGEFPAPRGPLTLEKASALRERLVARDERALEELIVLATPWLLSVAQRMLSDPDEAEDVVLDAFRILWDRVDTLSEEQPGLMPWLLRIVRNRAIDRLRARRRHGLRIDRARRSGVLGEDYDEPVTPNEAAQPGWQVHESVHAAWDKTHAKSAEWQDAQKKDGGFITDYARKNPQGEDLAESALFASSG